MLALIRRILSYKFFPLAFTLLTIILLCLPGSIVPGSGIFDIPNFDKFVHVVIFGMNVLFWGLHYAYSNPEPSRFRTVVIIATIFMIVLGVAMEYVQKYFVPNRSFDSWDIVADIAGCVIAAIWLWIIVKGNVKKKVLSNKPQTEAAQRDRHLS